MKESQVLVSDQDYIKSVQASVYLLALLLKGYFLHQP